MATVPGRSRRAEIILEAVRATRRKQMILDAVNSFYIYRTDTNMVLARGVQGYEAAKDKANELRKRYGLKWDTVKFKVERNKSASASRPTGGSYGGGRIDTAPRYNPSKRGRFRGVSYSDGSYADLD